MNHDLKRKKDFDCMVDANCVYSYAGYFIYQQGDILSSAEVTSFTASHNPLTLS